jgi:hypothetical protein
VALPPQSNPRCAVSDKVPPEVALVSFHHVSANTSQTGALTGQISVC